MRAVRENEVCKVVEIRVCLIGREMVGWAGVICSEEQTVALRECSSIGSTQQENKENRESFYLDSREKVGLSIIEGCF